MRLLPLLAVCVALTSCKKVPETAKEPEPTEVLDTLKQLAQQGEALKDVPFPTVIEGTTGKRVIPAPGKDDPLISAITAAVAESVERLNQEDSPVRNLRRINEASRYFEDEIMARLEPLDDFECGAPPTASGKAQRSGYPDLKIVHKPSGRVAYLDPKLFESGSRLSTLRTFYFEPKIETNKILDDAYHLLVGIEHDGNDGAWQFTAWHLVDLSKMRVRLKPEFQASNRDIYQDAAIIISSEESKGSK